MSGPPADPPRVVRPSLLIGRHLTARTATREVERRRSSKSIRVSGQFPRLPAARFLSDKRDGNSKTTSSTETLVTTQPKRVQAESTSCRSLSRLSTWLVGRCHGDNLFEVLLNILFQPCYTTLPIPPFLTEPAPFVPPLDGNALTSQFFFFSFFQLTFKRFFSLWDKNWANICQSKPLP